MIKSKLELRQKMRPIWKEKEFVIVDFGGGTLDIAYFIKGAKKQYDTIDFSLNQVLTDLGNILNDYKLGIPRPNILDSGFIKIMEDIIYTGQYKYVSTITIEGNQYDIKKFVDTYLQAQIDKIMEEIKIKLKISNTDAKYIDVFFIGGGAKLSNNQILQNKTFANKKIIENPQFANVEAYAKIAKSKRW